MERASGSPGVIGATVASSGLLMVIASFLTWSSTYVVVGGIVTQPLKPRGIQAQVSGLSRELLGGVPYGIITIAAGVIAVAIGAHLLLTRMASSGRPLALFVVGGGAIATVMLYYLREVNGTLNSTPKLALGLLLIGASTVMVCAFALESSTGDHVAPSPQQGKHDNADQIHKGLIGRFIDGVKGM